MVLVSYFMILLDNSVIFTGLPSIRAGLDLSDSGLSWAQDAYTLTFGGLLLLAARAGDLLGRRRVFVAGLAVFGIASLLVGVSPDGTWLIASRALQGIGAAIVAPTSLALITAHFDGSARRRAISLYAATAGIGASLGMLVGGALTDLVSWRAAFLVNVPIAALMIVGARLALRETPRTDQRLDVPGAVLTTAGMVSIVFGIIESGEVGWGSPRVVGALALGSLLLAALVAHEARTAHPIMPLWLFASRVRAGAYAARALYMGAMIGFFYFTTQLMQDGLGFSPFEAGLGFLPMTLVNFAVALAVPRLLHRVDSGVVMITGVALTAIGMVWLSRAGGGDGYISAIALPMLVIGTGQGLALAPLTDAALDGVPGEHAGAASGVLNTAHQLGMSLGLGALTALAAHGASSGGGAAETTERVRLALSGSTALLAVAVVVVTLARPRAGRR
ncbi:MFS transporter [Janibacter indicus]|nr:MFS transporter [Janibacter indicus]